MPRDTQQHNCRPNYGQILPAHRSVICDCSKCPWAEPSEKYNSRLVFDTHQCNCNYAQIIPPDSAEWSAIAPSVHSLTPHQCRIHACFLPLTSATVIMRKLIRHAALIDLCDLSNYLVCRWVEAQLDYLRNSCMKYWVVRLIVHCLLLFYVLATHMIATLSRPALFLYTSNKAAHYQTRDQTGWPNE